MGITWIYKQNKIKVVYAKTDELDSMRNDDW